MTRVAPAGIALSAALAAGCASAGAPRAAAQTGSPPRAADIPRFDSLRAKAATLAQDCPATDQPSANARGLLWTRGGAVYYASTSVPSAAVSSAGRRWNLPTNATPVTFLSCSPPVLAYTVGLQLYLIALGPRPKTLSLGRAVVSGENGIAPDWRFVVVHGRTVRYLGGPSLVAPGLPTGWKIADVVPSPRSERVFLAHVVAPGECGAGGLYRISPAGSTRLVSYDSCDDYPAAAWSPDGSRILDVTGSSLFVSGARGQDRRKLSGRLRVYFAIWSPDGRQIAFAFRNGVGQTGVVDVASGSVRHLTHLQPKRVQPPRQYPSATPLAWSPDGKEIALLYRPTANARATVATIAAGGGRPRILFRLGF